jgi:hypothetical protein
MAELLAARAVLGLGLHRALLGRDARSGERQERKC